MSQTGYLVAALAIVVAVLVGWAAILFAKLRRMQRGARGAVTDDG